ncbi:MULTISPECIES: hypothetical protein [unclassified Psychrobacter]|jgi:hypothetical protein|uniref:hypothetical protein n=1 Tax=unclassified Psychrobacter TaxID=196806 RepID=UPI000EE584AA|nr:MULTISPECIES: hypothetical protein [unclassified Psychrobacter]MBE8609852.1 hypothetical protein [Pseudomonas lundensis]MCG3809662.1 hypothetical protein [Psychrobacter sp. Ps4]HCI76462.1 hypothetical protein [Psychrobacter sp.]
MSDPVTHAKRYTSNRTKAKPTNKVVQKVSYISQEQVSNIEDRATDMIVTALLREYSNAPGGLLGALQALLVGGQATLNHVKSIFQKDYNWYKATGERLEYQELSSMPGIRRCLDYMNWDNYETFDEAWKDVGNQCYNK